jgi:NitT/TauT family transport system substrate-binding protein
LRHAWSGVLGASLLQSLVAAQSQSHANGLQPLTVALSQQPSLNHLPLVLAQQLGFFEAEGLALEVVEVDSDEQALQLVGRGTVALAACAFPHTLGQHARGADWVSLLVSMRAPQVVLGVSAHSGRGSDFNGANDLRGRKIGMVPTGPSWMVLDAQLRRNGLTTADVVLVPMHPTSAIIHAFRAGQVDALCVNDVGVVGLEQQGELRILADTRSLRGTMAVFGGALPGMALCARENWVNAHPDEAQKVVNALVHALKWLQTAGPSDLMRMVPLAHMAPDHALYLAALEKARDGFSVDGLMSRDAALTALAAQGRVDPLVRSARIDLSRTYTNEFVLRAKSRFKV